jgi:hypothetical protein
MSARLTTFIIASAMIVGLGRITVPGHGLSWPGTYEAFAHIWIGWMIGVATFEKEHRSLAVIMLIVLSLFELWMFLDR